MAGGSKLDYGRFMEKAMRGVMAEVLGHVARLGHLPGEHYFYITFVTSHPGVDIPAWLSDRYPNEMTIVLQEWFDDLAVMGDRFRVMLNFSDRPETLVIPLSAVRTFIDPSAKFGLKFDDHTSDDIGEGPGRIAVEAASEAGLRDDDGGEPARKPPAGEPQPHASADVVSLDRFRKG